MGSREDRQTRAGARPVGNDPPQANAHTATTHHVNGRVSAVPALGGVSMPSPGELRLRGGRAIVMAEEAYILLLQIIHEHAPHILKYAFYDMGYRAGVDLVAGFGGDGETPEAIFRQFVAQYAQTGYGDLTVDAFDLSLPEARLSGHNLFEAGLAGKTGIYHTPRVVDHYSRGLFAGFMSELLKREVVCEEITCQFRGDARCEFVVLPFQE